MTHRMLVLVLLALMTSTATAGAQDDEQGPWEPAFRLDTGSSDQSTDPTAAAGTQDVWLFWEQWDLKSPASIWAVPYRAASGWAQASAAESDTQGNARDPVGGVLPTGNAVAVWEHHDGTRFHTHASRHDAAAGWRPMVPLETHDQGKSHNPQVVVDAQGRALAVWDQPPNGVRVIRSASADINGGWTSARDVSAASAGPAEQAHLAVDGTTAMAAWLGTGPPEEGKAWAARYFFGSGWQTPVLLGEGTFQQPPGIAAAGGMFTIAWAEAEEGVRVQRWPTSSGPAEEAVTLAPVDGTLVAGPLVAATSDGALVAWLAEDDGPPALHAWLLADGAWDEAGAPDAGPTGRVTAHVVGWAGRDGPIVAWTSSGSPGGVWWSTLDVDSRAWSQPVALHAQQVTGYENLHAAFAANGRGAVAWEEFDGSARHAWAAVRGATPGAVATPTDPSSPGPGDGSEDATPGGDAPLGSWPVLTAVIAAGLLLARRGRKPEA